MFGTPKVKAEDIRYCTNCKREELRPHVSTMQSIKGIGEIYWIDHWFCPKCGLMYHFEDLEKIVEREE